MKQEHIPVLAEAVMAHFQPKSGDVLLDATLGLGGHARAYLQASAPAGKVIGLEADSQAIEKAQEELSEFGDRVTVINGNFANLKDSLTGGGILQKSFSHVLFDLGVGSHQLADEVRGFSFQVGGGLSMKYGEQKGLPSAGVTSLNVLAERLGHFPDVANILSQLSAEELAEVIWKYGEERRSRQIARAIKGAETIPGSAKALAELIAEAVPASYRGARIHPATRTFQALRLAVNRELEALQAALPQAVELLSSGGRLVVISFHSLEDRIVKRFFREQAGAGGRQAPRVEILTKRPEGAGEEEIARNPRARSAKMRVVRRL